jgi:acid phosphatase type 7
VFQGNCVDHGTVHVVVGSAGATVESTGFSPQIGNWSIAHADEYGYLRLRSTYDTLNAEFVLNRNGDVFDSFSVPHWV